ncbi:MAG TPA: inositol monophosphatase family protein [Candidatus Methylacidiphilales bacterium]|nr:inositol monophosphatase family protein [Candidatus Methylacidiphilales bacterium]
MIYAAITAAQAAGERLRHAFGGKLHVTEEFAHDIKIAADKECQDLIYSILLGHHPKTRCIGEEGDSGDLGDPRAEIEWIVDPIDGTMNFAHNIPHFCVSIAVRETASQRLLLGVIYDPLRHELFTAERGGGAWLNGVRQKVSSRATLGEAVLAVGFAKGQDSIDHCLELYKFYGNKARKLRAMGSAALDLAYVAAGRLDAYIEQGVNLWDIAAGVVLVEEAGGVAEIEIKAKGKYRVCAHSGQISYPMK